MAVVEVVFEAPIDVLVAPFVLKEGVHESQMVAIL